MIKQLITWLKGLFKRPVAPEYGGHDHTISIPLGKSQVERVEHDVDKRMRKIEKIVRSGRYPHLKHMPITPVQPWAAPTDTTPRRLLSKSELRRLRIQRKRGV